MHRLPIIIIVLLACRLFPQQSHTLSDIIDSIFPPNKIRPCTLFVDNELTLIPSLSKTRWDSTEIEAWVKRSDGCSAVTIRKEKDTRSFNSCHRITQNNSVILDCVRAVISEDKMYIASSFRLIIKKQGDTLRRYGRDEYEELGALDSCSDARLQFTGKIVAAAAQSMRTDTILHKVNSKQADTCYHCIGILVMAHAHDIMLGSAHEKKILLAGQRDSAVCNVEATRRAIKLINDKLKGKRFVIPSFYKGVFGGVALFSSRRDCECDSVSEMFPGVHYDP